jgi:probable rRNA maturation factor
MSSLDGPIARRRPGPPEGEVLVFSADEQHDADVDLTHLTALAEGVLAAEGVRGQCELSVYFVDESTIADLNLRFMDEPGPTDVLAFPIDHDVVDGGRAPDAGTTGPDRPLAEPDEVPLLLGDVLVCPAVAARNAKEHGVLLEDELALLVVHGILHVLGMDHAEPDETAAMQAKERALLERYHRPAPAPEPEPPGSPS